jgi:hypothetical protein
VTDRAVSTVVGSVLVLAVAVSALAIYQNTVVPQQKETLEAQRMDAAAGDMAALDRDLLDGLEGVASAPHTSPVRLGVETPAHVPESRSTQTLRFDPGLTGEDDAEITSPNLRIVTREGEPLLSGSGGDWKVVQGGETIEDITGVIGLRLKITDGSPADGDRLRVVASDADGDFAGDLTVRTDVNNPDLGLVLRTREPPSPGSVLFDNHLLGINQQHWDGRYWIDALLDLYWFDTLLEDAEKPATLTFVDEGLSAEYKVSYEKQAASGLSTTVGAGQEIDDYQRTFTSGSLEYDAVNEFYPDQTQTIEHGALVRSQGEGAAMLVEPPLTAEAGGGVVELGLSVPALEGESDAVSGKGVGTVRSQTTDRGTFGATAGQVNLSWDTDHPAPWSRFLEDELTEAGLTSSSCPPQDPSSPCQFEVTETATGVELTVHGPHALDGDPSDPDERDVALDVQHGTIETEVVS